MITLCNIVYLQSRIVEQRQHSKSIELWIAPFKSSVVFTLALTTTQYILHKPLYLTDWDMLSAHAYSIILGVIVRVCVWRKVSFRPQDRSNEGNVTHCS